MKKKTAIALTLAVAGLLSTCKKTDTAPPANTGVNTANTSIANGFPSSGTAFLNGVLYAQILNFPSMGYTGYNSQAAFSHTSRSLNMFYAFSSILFPGEPAGTVKINTTVLKYDITTQTSNNIYKDTIAGSSYSGGVAWDVSGNSNFTAFNTAVSRGFPIIANTGYLPASFSKSQPLVINFGLGNYTNTDSIMIFISVPSSGNGVTKYIAGNAASVTFTTAEMANLTTGGSGTEILVYAKNFSNMTVSGKNYIFIMHNDLGQFVTITP